MEQNQGHKGAHRVHPPVCQLYARGSVDLCHFKLLRGKTFLTQISVFHIFTERYIKKVGMCALERPMARGELGRVAAA
eukprot:3491815-Amphidinium_carterae.2